MAGLPRFEPERVRAESAAPHPAFGSAHELANYQKLVARAVDVFGDEVKASKWLSLPNSDLNGEVPLHYVRNMHTIRGRWNQT
jgi:uncharacterized protein (DUF2384 family)